MVQNYNHNNSIKFRRERDRFCCTGGVKSLIHRKYHAPRCHFRRQKQIQNRLKRHRMRPAHRFIKEQIETKRSNDESTRPTRRALAVWVLPKRLSARSSKGGDFFPESLKQHGGLRRNTYPWRKKRRSSLLWVNEGNSDGDDT